MLCSVCGFNNESTVSVCAACGRPIVVKAPPPPSATVPKVEPIPPQSATVMIPRSPILSQPSKSVAPPAPPRPKFIYGGYYQVQVSARQLRWPEICVCCGGASDTFYTATFTRTTGKRVIRSDTRYWNVPYCTQCLHHIREAKLADSFLSGGIALTLLGSFSLGIATSSGIVGGFLAAVGIVLSILVYQRKRSNAEAMTCGGCCEIKPAIVYHGWYGSVHTFIFRNGRYAEAFRASNASKVMR